MRIGCAALWFVLLMGPAWAQDTGGDTSGSDQPGTGQDNSGQTEQAQPPETETTPPEGAAPPGEGLPPPPIPPAPGTGGQPPALQPPAAGEAPGSESPTGTMAPPAGGAVTRTPPPVPGMDTGAEQPAGAPPPRRATERDWDALNEMMQVPDRVTGAAGDDELAGDDDDGQPADWPQRSELPADCNDLEGLKAFVIKLLTATVRDQKRFYEKGMLGGTWGGLKYHQEKFTEEGECVCGAFRYSVTHADSDFMQEIREVAAGQVPDDIKALYAALVQRLDECADRYDYLFERHCDRELDVDAEMGECGDLTQAKDKAWLPPLIAEIQHQADVRVRPQSEATFERLSEFIDALLALYRADTQQEAEAATEEIGKSARWLKGSPYLTEDSKQFLDDLMNHLASCMELFEAWREASSWGEGDYTLRVSPNGMIIVQGRPCPDGRRLELVTGESFDEVLNSAVCKDGRVTLRVHESRVDDLGGLRVRMGSMLYEITRAGAD